MVVKSVLRKDEIILTRALEGVGADFALPSCFSPSPHLNPHVFQLFSI